jgi:hypothetical protein
MATFRGTLPEVFEARQAELFFKQYAQEELIYPQVFNVKPITKAYDDAFRVSGLGPFVLKPEGTPIGEVSTFALGYRVTMEARDDDQYDLIDEFPRDLGDAARDHQENLAFALFNDAFDGNTFTGLDTLALCTTAHTTLKHKTPGTTLSNQISPGIALSVTLLESMITRLRLTQSEEGRQIPLSPAVLMIHPDEAFNATKLLESEREPFTSDNQINATSRGRTGISPLSVPYLTDTDAVFLGTEKSKHGVFWYDRMGLKFDDSKDSQTKDSLFDGMYRAEVGIRGWRGWVGSQP